jgi:hypothetical protein
MWSPFPEVGRHVPIQKIEMGFVQSPQDVTAARDLKPEIESVVQVFCVLKPGRAGDNSFVRCAAVDANRGAYRFSIR